MFEVNVKDSKLIFPIDAWVKQIINRLGLLNGEVWSKEKLKNIKDLEVKEKVIGVCLKHKVDIVNQFNLSVANWSPK